MSTQKNCSNAVGRNKYCDTPNPGENNIADSVIRTASTLPPSCIVISPQIRMIKIEFM